MCSKHFQNEGNNFQTFKQFVFFFINLTFQNERKISANDPLFFLPVFVSHSPGVWLSSLLFCPSWVQASGSSQPSPAVPPPEVVLSRGERTVLTSKSPACPVVWGAQRYKRCQAEARVAIADLEQTTGPQKSLSLAREMVDHGLQVVKHCCVTQLLPTTQPVPPQHHDARR